MIFSLNPTLTCYYFETLLSRDVNSPRRLPDVNKGPRQYGARLNLILTCYYFETCPSPPCPQAGTWRKQILADSLTLG